MSDGNRGFFFRYDPMERADSSFALRYQAGRDAAVLLRWSAADGTHLVWGCGPHLLTAASDWQGLTVPLPLRPRKSPWMRFQIAEAETAVLMATGFVFAASGDVGAGHEVLALADDARGFRLDGPATRFADAMETACAEMPAKRIVLMPHGASSHCLLLPLASFGDAETLFMPVAGRLMAVCLPGSPIQPSPMLAVPRIVQPGLPFQPPTRAHLRMADGGFRPVDLATMVPVARPR